MYTIRVRFCYAFFSIFCSLRVASDYEGLKIDVCESKLIKVMAKAYGKTQQTIENGKKKSRVNKNDGCCLLTNEWINSFTGQYG